MLYPEMTVEKRDGKSHGLVPPTKKGDQGYSTQLQDTIDLCNGMKEDGYSELVRDILWRYSPVRPENVSIEELLTGFGFPSWRDVCDFVRDDECIHFFMLLVIHLKKQGKEYRKEKDFIDGTGFGIYRRYIDRAVRTLEQAFDEKYLHKETRPLEDLKEMTGVDFSGVAEYVHPGHFRYPAGHGAKFYEAADHAFDAFAMSDNERKIVIFLAYVFSMGRSGILVHLPEDNIAGGYLADLKEFKNWKK